MNRSSPLRPALGLAFPLLGLALSASLARAQYEIKVPAPLPNMQDIKTPAPSSVPTTPVLPEHALHAPHAPTQAHELAAAKLPNGLHSLPPIDREKVYVNAPDAGRIWAHGKSWKAAFGAEGTEFVPFFGSRAPRNYPILFKLESARAGEQEIALNAPTLAQPSASRVDLDRTGLIERYDMAASELEQSFVFTRVASASSDLSLRLSIETELHVERVADGIDFSNELGRVHYGGAKVIDAAGRELALEIALDSGRIEMRVPSSFLSQAVFPVTIDPTVSVFSLDATGYNDYNPDVAYDVSTDHYLAVYEEDYSATDHDIYSILFQSDGTSLYATYPDSTTAYWGEPSVANTANNSEFLVVAQVRDTPGALFKIMGRAAGAFFGGYGSTFQISENLIGEMFHPVVGGDPTFAPPVYYLVVWQRNYSSTDNDIHGRLVAGGGLVQGSTIFIDNTSGTVDWLPSVSKSDGTSPSSYQDWNVAWSRQNSASQWDVYGAQVHWTGAITTPSFALDTTFFDDRDVSVSTSMDDPSGPRKYMVVVTRNFNPDRDLLAYVMQGSTVLDYYDLQALENAGTQSEFQWSPHVDCDGKKFGVLYSESYQGSADFDTWISTFEWVGGSLVCNEAHASLGYSSAVESPGHVVATHSGGGGANDFMSVWTTQATPSDTNIDAGLYSAPSFTSICVPGQNAMTCPCGNSPLFPGRGCDNSSATGGALLSAWGSPAADTVSLTADFMKPSATCVFLQGNVYLGVGVGAAFGDGVRCIGGQLLRIGLKVASGGSAAYPEPGDLSIKDRAAALGAPIAAGSQRFYQTYYRDPVNFACAAPATFNISSGVVIDW